MEAPQAAVVGAGIAGLAAAIALRRAGWEVEVFERSTFKNEIGAAITVGANATRVLDRWGFDFETFVPTSLQKVQVYIVLNMQKVVDEEFPNIEEEYGNKCWTMHRVDLHKGLLQLATETDESGKKGQPVTIRLGQHVEELDPEKGIITFSDGKTLQKQLVVVADGVHVS